MVKRTLILLLALSAPLSAQAGQRIVVRPGDTLSRLAARYHVSVTALARANGIRNVNLVRSGTWLILPSRHGAAYRSRGQGHRVLGAAPHWYKVRWGDTLSGIAFRYRVSVATLHILNPQLGSYPLAGELLRVRPHSRFRLRQPSHHAGRARYYLVRPGDTLSGISARFRVSYAALHALNPRLGAYPLAGQRLLVCASCRGSRLRESPAARPVRVPHHSRARPAVYLVRPGDSLTALSARFGLSVATIRLLNPRLGPYPLVGQRLQLCSACAARPAPRATRSVHGGYLVRTGDTLSGIAAHFGITTVAIMNANHLLNANLVRQGMALRIPRPSPVVSPAAPHVVQTVPYDPAFTRSVIVSTAQQYGVDPALALAIGWQESGFNQNMVSPTGAIGVMQVEPYTGRHIAAITGRPVNLHSLNGNIAAGVYWIAQLLRYYGGNERLAVAAYYEGSQALAQRGFLHGTRRYVSSVMNLRASYAR